MHDFIDKLLEGSRDKFAEIRDNDKTVDNIFSSYQETFERNYKSMQEKRLRRSLFKKHLMNIIKINSNAKLTYKASINAFSDMAVEEFNAQKKGLKIPKKSKRRLDNDDDNDDNILSPSSREDARNGDRTAAWLHRQARQTSPSLDWVSLGRVTSVKDQLQCGDCYAFATMAVLEGLWMNTVGNLVDFSPQELTDCSSTYGKTLKS
jgi:C1A family cysteine protease